jgi:hypothetical protein
MPRHPHFYLPSSIVKAITVQSFRREGRSCEASRCRGTLDYSVPCDAATAGDFIERIEAARRRSDDPSFRDRCAAAVMTIRIALEEASVPQQNRAAPSHLEQGYIGTKPVRASDGTPI